MKQSANSLQIDQLEVIEDNHDQHDDQSDAQTADEDDVNPDAIGSSMATSSDMQPLLYSNDQAASTPESHHSKLFGGN